MPPYGAQGTILSLFIILSKWKGPFSFGLPSGMLEGPEQEASPYFLKSSIILPVYLRGPGCVVSNTYKQVFLCSEALCFGGLQGLFLQIVEEKCPLKSAVMKYSKKSERSSWAWCCLGVFTRSWASGRLGTSREPECYHKEILWVNGKCYLCRL